MWGGGRAGHLAAKKDTPQDPETAPVLRSGRPCPPPGWCPAHARIFLIATDPYTTLVDNYKILVGAGVAVVALMALVFGMDALRGNIAIQDYEIFVDPLIDKQNLFITGRVTIQNTGGQPLTNVWVDFGQGQTLRLGTLEAGKKVIVSPPSGSEMEFVRVFADPDIFVSKTYREPLKMVGMMGS